MSKIQKISASKILDSAGEPTVEVGLTLDNGLSGAASIPSGISEGQWEAKTVPADQAIKEIEKIISPLVCNREFVSQGGLDKVLKNLNCGANATLPVSLAFCRAAKTLYFPKKRFHPKLLMLLFEGAKHGSKDLTIQEFMVVAKSLEKGIGSYQKIEDYLKKQGLPITVGAEGGFSPTGLSDEKVLDILERVLGKNTFLALDIAAPSRRGKDLDYVKLVQDYTIVLIEDPYRDDDWTNWSDLTKKIGKKVLIVGDDLTATSPIRIRQAAERKAVGGVVIKPDQRKTLTEVLGAVEVAKQNGLKIVVSHRGRETNDPFIADLALAIQADYVKFGGPVRGERVAKYNRLLEIFGP